jgi:hypothetical protein
MTGHLCCSRTVLTLRGPAALVFRLVNFWLAIAVGWVSFAVIGGQLRRVGQRLAGQARDADLPAIAAPRATGLFPAAEHG